MTMSHSFASRLRRFGAGTAAILLVAGAAACGGGNDSADRGDGKMKSMLGGGNEQRSDRGNDRDRDERRDGNSERDSGDASSNSAERTARIGPDSQTSNADQFDRRVRIVNNSDMTITLLKGSPT